MEKLNKAEQQLADRFHTAFRDVQRRLRQRLQEQLAENAASPVTRGQFFLMRHLHRHTTLTISELAAWMSVKPATMSTIVDRMEKNGWVRRVKDERDRRTVHVHMTEEASALIGQADASWQAMLADELGLLPVSDRLALVELLEKLNEQADRRG